MKENSFKALFVITFCWEMQVNWARGTEVKDLQSSTFPQIDPLVVILSIKKPKTNMITILNFGNQWTIIRRFSNLFLN